MNKDIIKAGSIIELKEGHNIILGKKYNKGEQMSNKYIIKNCNVLYYNLDGTAICNDLTLEQPCYCKERTDCILKQIVDECNKGINYSQCNCGAINNLVNILDLLDIEECDNE